MPPRWFKRAWRGLYGDRQIMFGNQVSFAGNKKRRSWKPNVQMTTLYSETLGEQLRTKVTTHVMRCIRKAGGFDQYLLQSKNSSIKYPKAIDMKQRIIDIQNMASENGVPTRSHGGKCTGKVSHLIPDKPLIVSKETKSVQSPPSPLPPNNGLCGITSLDGNKRA